VEEPSKMLKRSELNAWALERELDFKKVLKFLHSASDKLTGDDSVLSKKLQKTEYENILENIDETRREICIVMRRIEIFRKKYKTLSDNHKNFSYLKTYTTATAEVIESFKDNWNMTMHKIDRAIRLVKE